ncbi:hypothetical protein J2Z44_003757, partial [Clostridium punense]|nr:hypothetical protein [Clostridium punense]MBP2023912.1 hypothetical protein [Clostridium punense]
LQKRKINDRALEVINSLIHLDEVS